MRALVQSYPPLGQVTVVRTSRQSLTVILEVSADREREPWEASLWTSVDEEAWHEVKLSRTEDHLKPRLLQKQPAGSTFLYFSGHLYLQKCAKFTVKFRPSGDKTWRWVRDEDGLGDGIILLQFPGFTSENCSRLHIPDLKSEWTVTSEISQSPGTRLWSLQCPIKGSAGNDSSVRTVEVGTPWGSFLRWFALVRHQPAWLGPRQGSSRFMVDADAILCCFLSCEGQTMAMVAVSGVENMSATFKSNAQNTISVHARNDSISAGTVHILISEGPQFDNTVASVMYEARKLVSPYAVSQVDPGSFGGLHTQAAAAAQWQAEWYDGLGFCTWNSLGQQLSEKSLLIAVEELAKNEIHITNLITDDNWQSIDRAGHDQSQYGLVEFEADPHAFPSGLGNLVKSIRKLHPDIRHVLVWHALFGYWGGISPNGAIAATYKTSIVAQSSKDQSALTVIAKEDVARFYDDFYTFLVESGVDGVKTDVQVMLDLLAEAPDRRELTSTYLDEWSKASQKHFGEKTISCMAQFPQALFRSQLPQSYVGRIVRNSDDYFPNEPASHPWHIWANAHNAIFTRLLNVIPDWDMFQSAHSHSEFHAAARCVSGGPVYITDVPGKHNMPLIKQMTALTPLGRTIVLRPSSLGRSIRHYEAYEDGSLLKIGSYHGASQAGTGILGVFNVSTRRINELLPLDYFPGILPSVDYVIRAHTTGKLSELVSLERPAPLISMSLEVREYEILCAFPVTSFKGRKYIDGHAGLVGLTAKMTGCAALTRISILKPRAGRLDLVCSLRALGILGVFVSTLPSMTIGDDVMVTIEDIPVPIETVEKSETDARVLNIDVERAWKVMNLATCSLRPDEITVKCTVNV
ncbi:hypothetical protein E4U55_004159 [Claviceps digitariae]|nr:hypothetical protein E4U55_004159 [Claviceps digitariae]